MFVHTPKGALAKPTINIVTSVGKSWMMWDAARMTLVFVGKEADEEIRGLEMNGTEVFASAGSKVHVYERGREVGFTSSSMC
jgi:U3 small nucleolar RNA-associated protein 21